MRFWRELGSVAGAHDPVVRLIVVERLAKAVVLVALAVALLGAGRLGSLRQLVDLAEEQLNLSAGQGLISRLLMFVLEYVARLPHLTVLAIGALAYAALEVTEGVGLAMRRRWAEYLTVLATGLLIPYELVEVVDRPTALRVGALAVNVAIVVYLAYRKRLFVDV